MSTELTTTRSSALQAVVAMVTDAVTSPHTKRAYGRALTEFITWHQATGQPLNKAAVNAYVQHLRSSGRPASSINQALVAIRKLAREAADNELIDHSTAEAIGRAEGVKATGTRMGNWLTKAQAQALLNEPNAASMKGIRDRALLSLLLGCGLRREEAASLTFEHIQQREGRWVIVNLRGKRNKVRSVPMPSWAKAALDYWQFAAGISTGIILRPVTKGGKVITKWKRLDRDSGQLVTCKEGDEGAFIEGMAAQTIYGVVSEYAVAIDLGDIVKVEGKRPAYKAQLHPHDLRRTFAKLAHKGGSSLDQIQLSLGHESIQTTEKYLGITQDLTSAPCDALGLRLDMEPTGNRKRQYERRRRAANPRRTSHEGV